MNYADMKRVFRRGGMIDMVGKPTIVSLKEMLTLFPIGKRGLQAGGLRDYLRGARSFVLRKKVMQP